MTGKDSETAARQMDRLFREGTVAGMTDAELLGRFVDRRDEAAMTALVARHGPMVLGICNRVLHHQDDAEDAFQATFLVLVRKARSLRVERTLSAWLYRVSYRIAVHAKLDARRRQMRERRSAAMRPRWVVERSDMDQDAWILEEVDRLPEKYRVPIVLCGLEGMTLAMAAQQLGCPIGTVSGRLSRARGLLQARLTRRGVTIPIALLATGLAASTAYPAVPAALAASTVEAVRSSLTNGALSQAVLRLADTFLRSLLMTRIALSAAALLAGGTIAVGIGAASQQSVKAPLAPPDAQASTPAAGPRTPTPDTSRRTVLRDAFRILNARPGPPDVRTLVAIARAQARLGDRAAALATLERASEAADGLPRDSRTGRTSAPYRIGRTDALVAIAYGHAEAGDPQPIPAILRRARADADRAGDENEVFLALKRIGDAQAWTGDQPAARETARTMLERMAKDPSIRNSVTLMRVADLLALAGDLDGALGVADSVERGDEKREILAGIATPIGSALPSWFDPPRDRMTVAQRTLRLQVLRRILRDYENPPLEVAIALTELGQGTEALPLIERLRETQLRRVPPNPIVDDLSLARIASALAKAGQREAARKTFADALDRIRDVPGRDSRFEQFAYEQANSGEFEGALRTATMITPTLRARIRIRIAGLQAKAGERADAKTTYRLALEDARACLADPPKGRPQTLSGFPEYWKARSLSEIATIQAGLGEFATALATLLEITTTPQTPEPVKHIVLESMRWEVWFAIAREQAGAGKGNEVLTWAFQLENPERLGWALRGLAEGIVDDRTVEKPAPERP